MQIQSEQIKELADTISDRMDVEILKDIKNYSNNKKEHWDSISKYIKYIENFLLDNNPHCNFTYRKKEYAISWSQVRGHYRLFGHISTIDENGLLTESKVKPVIEWNIDNRVIFHSMLSNFINELNKHVKEKE